VVSLQLSVVSFQLSVDCLAATRRGARGNLGLRISDCGMGSESRTTNHEPRITQKLSGRTKPNLRKLNAAREKGRGLPQSEDDRRSAPGCGGPAGPAGCSCVPLVIASARCGGPGGPAGWSCVPLLLRGFRMKRWLASRNSCLPPTLVGGLGALRHDCQPASAGLLNSSRSPAEAGSGCRDIDHATTD